MRNSSAAALPGAQISHAIARSRCTEARHDASRRGCRRVPAPGSRPPETLGPSAQSSAAAHSTRGLRLRCPQRLDNFHHHRHVDAADEHGAKNRGDVGREGVRPLLAVPHFSRPACGVRRPRGRRTLWRARLRSSVFSALRRASGRPLSTSKSRCALAFFRASDRPIFERPPRPISRALPCDTNATLRAATTDAEVEAASVSVEPLRRLVRARGVSHEMSAQIVPCRFVGL